MKIGDAPKTEEGGLQRNDAWYEARAGRVTASPVLKVYKKTKAGYSTQREDYKFQLIAERLVGTTISGFKSASMTRGIQKEAEARERYQRLTNYPVTEVGFIPHPTIEMAGASPDGFVGDDGIIEVKCPDSKQAVEVLLNDYLDDAYKAQMMWQLACTGRQWADYVVFDDRLPPPMQLYVRRIERDDKLIADVETEVRKFLSEIAADMEALAKKYPN